MTMEPERTYRMLACAEALYSRVLDEYAITTACRRGCHWCCYEPVDLHVSEVQLLGVAVRELGRRMARSVRQKSLRLAHKVHRHGIGIADGDADRYRALRVLCPLCEDGECLVYHARPLVCRFHAVRSNPDLCRPERTEHNQTVVKCQEILGAVYVAFGSAEFMGLPGGLAQALGDREVPISTRHNPDYFLTIQAIHGAADRGAEVASTVVRIANYLRGTEHGIQSSAY